MSGSRGLDVEDGAERLPLAAEAGTDASWVLDGRFEALLEEGDTDTARRIRVLGRKIEDREPWRGLRAALTRHGLT